ncbi:hypothetical protein D046_6213A, partial [Vibrio parahaemolyticus V-223/04]|jgi:hypothetical protein
MQR